MLEVSINGRTTELVGQFTKRQDGLFATAGELRSLGIKVPGKEDELVPISGVTSKIDLNQTALKIDMEVPMNFLNTTDIATSGKSADNVPLTENARGVLLNYDLLATTSEGVHSLGGYFDGRYFSGSSVFSSTGLAYFAGSPAKSARLDTTYTYSNPRELIRYRVGDFITSGLSWTRPVRFGGAQFGTDFSLRPDLIKYPTPSLGGEAVVPSTVDLFVNGVRQLSQPVPPGRLKSGRHRSPPVQARSRSRSPMSWDARLSVPYRFTLPTGCSQRTCLPTLPKAASYAATTDCAATIMASSPLRGLRATDSLKR
ncbi:hypothetical protein PQR63_17880 [Herbaspirillum rhizosphaerae]|uniref:Uncharacterized protein n=1 Tax=Herbaspirillum rhizosphaerae TaxID=346179 RepID=A0ABW8ZDN6_9BURK